MIIERRPSLPVSEELASAFGPVLGQILADRGFASSSEVSNELSQLLSFHQLAGLPEALALLQQGLEQGWHLCLVGDFDVDGATSVVLGLEALRAMGAARVSYAVPNRFDYGYGLTPALVDAIAPSQPQLLITVDNGIAAQEGVAHAQALDMKVLVTDHHLPGESLPTADAIVNPNQPGCGFAAKNSSGCTVLFYLLSALRAHLQQTGWFASRALPVPVMADYLDLVALATVADVVPLDANNRILVAQGLKRMRAGRLRPGLAALLQVAKRPLAHLRASDLGFALGPRINAAGRLDDITLGIECLLCGDPNLALQMAEELDAINQERRQIETEMQERADDILRALQFGDQPDAAIVVYDPAWHQGVIGLLASRLKERWYRPVIALAPGGDGILKGSARSIPGLHLRDALDLLSKRYPGLFIKFGGHAMAAGMSLHESQLPRLKQALPELVAELLTPDQLRQQLWHDGELPLALISAEFALQLQRLGPWGQHCPEPVFFGRFQLQQQRLLKGKHLKMMLSQQGMYLDAIAFNVNPQDWPNPLCKEVELVYRLDINHYQGESRLQLMVEHLRPVME